ncbi:helix-turn-helix domain-containing protein [Arthrobacter sp. Alg241-R88]|uniref:helix-turn-helix domain-containing protein n=1 Tax=Arthrobacter sp. Alg241-R88 TaxID=2305984 RepID=UPI0013D44D24|nr:helix-turn-helix domain-containing protein [Arthrobacter sp. Alg241-R88]
MTDIDPIFVSVKEAARMLGLSPWAIYQKLDQQVIESRYDGRKRLVVVASLREYAANLPATAPKAEAS